MREFLDDVHKHMQDGIGRAQAHARQELRRRFYRRARVGRVTEGFSVLLDGKGVKTPGGKPVLVAHEKLAEALCAEWNGQATHIDPRTMPLTRLVNSAIEGGEEACNELRAEIVRFAGNDLLLFHAESPRELVALQGEVWGSILSDMTARLDVVFHPVTGIVHRDQPEESLQRIRALLPQKDHVTLTALASITGLTGSGLLVVALFHGLMDADRVWDAAHLDEDYNARIWGVDREAMARRRKRRAEFDAAVKVLELTGQLQPEQG